jgi:hypothetical protein
MSNPKHSVQVAQDGIHTPITWLFSSSIGRNNFAPTAGVPAISTDLTSVDIYKFAMQTDTNTVWILSNISPVTWAQVGAAGADTAASYVLVTATGSLPGGVVHETLRQLIHLDNENGPRGAQWANNLVKEAGPIPFITASIWWTDNTKTKRIVDQIVTRNVNRSPATIQWRAYLADGVTVAESYTDTISYSGLFEISRTRTQP